MISGKYNPSDGLISIALSAPVTSVLVLANIIVFIVLSLHGSTLDTTYMVRHGALYAPYVISGEYYRIFTSMFMHFGIEHIASNMLGLFCLGSIAEQELGRIKYSILYILSGVGAGIASSAMALINGSSSVSAGASGAIFGIIGSICTIMIKRKGHFRNMRPANVALMAGYSLFAGFTDIGIDNAAHVGGLLTGFIIALIIYHPHTIRKDDERL